MLLGADIYSDLLFDDGPSFIRGHPSSINTVLGWVVFGPSATSTSPTNSVALLSTVDSLLPALTKFWEAEEVAPAHVVNPDDQFVEEHFCSTHYREESGRYVVSLPFKRDASPPAENSRQAYSSYLHLETRLLRQPPKYAAYLAFMREYLQLGHMTLATTRAPYVIPHHCVVKEDGLASKLRVVFNASARDASLASLNDRLLCGPKLQLDIADILTSFRVHRVALCCDVKMMYRQVALCPADRKHQHIYWRADPSEPVREYELNTVTYGLAPSAYQAQRVIRQLVHDEGSRFPLASNSLLLHTYVDDIITGGPDPASVLELREQLIQLMSRGSFQLRKWASNSPLALTNMPPEHLVSPLIFSTEDKAMKILGMQWNPQSDSFSFRVKPFTGPVTKRTILSYIARVFDPLGMLSPLVFSMKTILQELWLAKVGWDDDVPPVLNSRWCALTSGISILESIAIPRCVFPPDLRAIQVVGFSDASQAGYSAAIYLRVPTSEGFDTWLWKAKSKVAPLKPMTIPRLELCGALLLARLLWSCAPTLNSLPVTERFLFTDSQVVLAWLSTPPHLLKTFVANRVVAILDLTSPSQWRHVPTRLNPADYSSRGMNPVSLASATVWFRGPPFVSAPLSSWPQILGPEPASIQEPPELKPVVTFVSTLVEPPWSVLLIEQFSSLLRMQRVVAWMFRFVRNTRSSRTNLPAQAGPLTADEQEAALLRCVQWTQLHYHKCDIASIAQDRPPSHSLLSLSPYLDGRGLLRVGGRLSHSKLSVDAKHPLLLPKRAHLSRLICEHYHLLSLHAGPRTVQALIQSKFWIISLRGLLRQRIRQCLTCHRFRAPHYQPRMADLPAPRVCPQRPFLQTGVDFAGPFVVKLNRTRKSSTTKGYLCLFVCTATKAVHLEFVSELSTDAFLATLDRFVARRGLPSRILSDRGRNFVGAANRLADIQRFLQRNAAHISDHLSSRGITWQFNPPYAPHFGGLWESNIKGAKQLLYRLIGDTPLTFEEYSSIFCRIEAVLNSRPLCSVDSDSSEASDYLSPGHFLIGAPLLACPTLPVSQEDHPRSRWQRTTQLFQAFWRRWSTEYLQSLIQKGKWHLSQAGPKVGDVVIVPRLSLGPLSWPLGRIIEIHPGSDLVARVATIRTPSGPVTRAVRGLIPLPDAH